MEQYYPNSFAVRTLDALQKCRTPALGGHKDVCDCCGQQRISYNSFGNRHCLKCQSNKQTNKQTNKRFGPTTGSLMPWM
ncbi:MAG: transposase zinc-binding domain-containing protein [Prolixibacteraceae bacterium]|nr:transposase zinc-binding domain-containing protein [Prolixibacteraceae bacterium]